MKILVCIARTPDTTARIAFTDEQKRFDDSGVTYIINPYDEYYGLVRALELKETLGATVHLICVGGPDVEPVIRKALALGGDEAIRVNTGRSDSYGVASQIAAQAKEGAYDIVFCGKETIDYNGSEVGGMVAGLLNYPFVSLATHFEVEGEEATIRREIEGGEEICKVRLPLVVSCMKGMAEPRIAHVKGIVSARTKPLRVVEAVETETLTATVRFELPPPKGGVTMVDAGDMDELVRLLHEEAKVI